MFNTIDMHCDTLMAAEFRDGPDADIFDCPQQAIDIKNLLNAKAMAQFFAIYIPRGEWLKREKKPVSSSQFIEDCAQIFENTISSHSDVVAKACRKELERRKIIYDPRNGGRCRSTWRYVKAGSFL